MKRLYLILLSVFALLNTAMAQELTVKSFVLAPTDITAQTEGRKDLNGDACALVKIFVVGDVADVEGNVVMPLVKKNSQTWAFMTQGSKQMQVIAQNALPLMVTFADYGIGKLESNRTYILTLNQVGGASASTPSTSSTSNVIPSKSTSSPQTTSSSPTTPSGSVISIPVKDGVSIEMVKVEAGTFTMGATKGMYNSGIEKPAHKVTLTQNYYIGKYEVTQAIWEAVMGDNPSYFKGENLPVDNVSWEDCQLFVERLNGMTGRKFRFPTEAEWEYAARGGNKSKGYRYSGSNTLNDVAWFWNNSDQSTHPVGTKLPNELGIFDMSGNVSEWCQDWFGAYRKESQTNPIGASNGSQRICRNGGVGQSAQFQEVAHRWAATPDAHDNYGGFRLVFSE